MLANRIRPLEGGPFQTLVDDHDQRRPLSVALGERSASHQPQTNGAKIRRAHNLEARVGAELGATGG